MEQILNTVLLYSLGLGLVLAVLTGLTLALTRSSSPLLRYRILVGLLGLFTAAIVLTSIVKLYAPAGYTEPVQQISAQPKSRVISQTALSGASSDIMALGKDFLGQHARTISVIWLFIVLIKSIRLGSNLFELHHLKTRQIYPAGKYWEDEVARLGKKIGLKKAVRVLQSGLTQVPLVIGHFRPVILIPLGMITAIKPQELEMMLLHELAHIRRLDFLVNILQHVLELLFFFNPAVLWISALIRRERENCCDEMVLQNSAEKLSYIQALLSFREYQLNVPAYAMAFAKESNLITRVKRMVYQKNTALSSIEKGCLLLAVVLLCSFSVLRSSKAAEHKAFRFQEPVVKRKKSTEKRVPPPPAAALPAPPAPPAAPAPAPKRKSLAEPAKPVPPPPPAQPKLSNSSNLGSMSVMSNNNLNTSSNIRIDARPATVSQIQLSTLSALRSTTSTYSKVIVKPSNLTEELISALEKAGISTKGERLTFHISNKELVVNGKEQPVDVLRAVLKDFLKSPEDTIDFTYNRDNNAVNTSSNYYRK